MNFKKFINRKTVISLSLVVLISTGAYFGIKSKAASNSSTNTAYATGYEEMTEEDREWLYDNATIVDSAEDFYDLMEDGELDQVYNDQDAKEADEKDYAEGKTLRTAVDNSQSLYFPPIKTQGSVGSCCSFANVYYQFTYTYNKSVETRSKGDEYLYSPMWTYEQAYMNAAPITRILMEQGAVSCKYLPIIDDVSKYESGEVAEHNCHANAEIQREARKHRISGIYMIPDITGSNITSPDSEELLPLKTALNNGEVLSFTADIFSYNVDSYKIEYDSEDENFKDTSNKKYKGDWICPRCDQDGDGAHRMTLVGYDDNIWVDINQNGVKEIGEMGAFKIANSWGTGWGNKGFMWVSYDALNRLSSVSEYTTVPLKRGKYPFRDVMGYIVKEKYPEAYAQFTVKTDHIASIDSGYIIASNSKEEHEYRINVFDMKFYDFTFDGTRKTSTGTFIYPLDNVVEDVDKNFDSYNWKFRFTDTADEYPLQIVDVNIVKGDKIYKPKLPGKVKCDGNTVDIDMSTIANNGYEGIVLNYEGKTNDYIHYSVNGKWTEAPGVPLIKIGDKSMFVINKKSSDKFVCCFNDGKGNWDNNDTKDYTISDGFYNIKDKKVNKYGSSINDAPYEAQLIADSYGPVAIGSTIRLSVDEIGNAEAANYYKFGYIDPETKEEVIIKESSLENNAEFKAVKAGKYNLFVYIYKLNNSFERKYIYNYVVEQPEITWFLNDIYSPQRKGTKINFEVRTTKLSPECSVKIFAKDSDGNEEILKQDGENNYVWVPSKIDKYTIVAQILYGTEVIDERIISDYKIITDDTRFKILDITMNNKDVAIGDTVYAGIEFDGGQSPVNYEVGYKYDNKEQYLLTADAYSTYNSIYLTAPQYDGKVTLYVKAHDATGAYSYKELEFNVHRFKINGIKYEPEGKIIAGETVRLSVDTEYERTYKAPNTRKFTITNLSTNETIYYSSYGYTTEWRPKTAGKYRIQVDVTSYMSGSDTYTTELKVYKNNNDGLYIDSVIPSIESPAKLGDSIYFTIDRVNEVENVDNYAVYKIVNIETNETVTATEYVYNDGGRFVWTPDKAGKYNIMVEFFAGNESAAYSLDYEVVEKVAKNTVTIYYKGFSTPYIHYAINNAWTNVPGIAMTATSEMEGYTHKAVIELPENETKLVACFNDGNNHWDSANGKNYTFGLGEYTYSNGKIRRVGEYKDLTTIYYKGFENPYIHYSINGKWTNLPGIPMTRTNIVSGYTHEINIEMDNADEVVVCFNDGKGNWDSRNGQNYTFGVGTYYYSNGKITAK